MAIAARHVRLEHALARLSLRFGRAAVLPGERAEARRAQRRVSFGVRSLDALLEGGLVPGEPLAVLGARSTGMVTLALRAAASAQSRGGEVAWVDPTSTFEPIAAARAGIALDRLLLVRCAPQELAFVTATLARAAAFTLVVVDLGPQLAREPSVDALAPALPHLRSATAPALVLSRRQAAREPLPAIELRHVEWLRAGGRIVGWRSRATRPHLARVASVAFLPLALPPLELVDEGIRARASQEPEPLRAEGPAA